MLRAQNSLCLIFKFLRCKIVEVLSLLDLPKLLKLTDGTENYGIVHYFDAGERLTANHIGKVAAASFDLLSHQGQNWNCHHLWSRTGAVRQSASQWNRVSGRLKATKVHSRVEGRVIDDIC